MLKAEDNGVRVVAIVDSDSDSDSGTPTCPVSTEEGFGESGAVVVAGFIVAIRSDHEPLPLTYFVFAGESGWLVAMFPTGLCSSIVISPFAQTR